MRLAHVDGTFAGAAAGGTTQVRKTQKREVEKGTTITANALLSRARRLTGLPLASGEGTT